MDLGIRGRKGIVNGGSAGMGKAAAFALAREGVELVLSARGEARLRATAGEIEAATGVRVIPVVADHSQPDGLARILAACPAPDILVGTCSPPPMTEDYRAINPAQWQASLDTGLMSPVNFMNAVLDGMVARRWGRIVNIASIAAKFPLELRILSGAPRAALINYAGAVAMRVVQHGVTINNVLPGMFHTAFTLEQFGARARAAGSTYEDEVAQFAQSHRIAAQRFGDTQDVGALVAWLCSQFAGYITGQSIVIDGGATRSTF
jgi:3-oxoacyl-[acyl-carrier protein] reductase